MHSASSKPLGAFVAIVISLIAAGGTVGGFFVGRASNGDAYVQKTRTLTATMNSTTWLYSVLGAQLDDPVNAKALAELYGVRVGDREALAKRLLGVAWIPADRPAPFVGHLARPQLGDDLHINMLGFRDDRQSYVTKADRTVRIFMTGGSTAWGSGASSQKTTISYLLERLLNERMSPVTGYRYEVINTAFPAWSTTQEKLLIQQRLVDMYPDVILMFSGNNDIHWSRDGRDIRWFYSPEDDNYLLMLNELYKSSGHAEWTVAAPATSRQAECSNVARVTARNVEEAASAAGRVKARLIFALQPNVATTAKRLTMREQHLPEVQNKPYWESCYRALRENLGQVRAGNYRLIDLSRSLGEVDGGTEVFLDSYHFADLGNRLMARALAAKIDWRSIVPSASVKPDASEELKIVRFEPTESVAGRAINQQSDGTAALRIVANRFDKNLLVIFDKSVLPTVIANDSISARMPVSLYATRGEHTMHIVDSMTGETSPPVIFYSR